MSPRNIIQIVEIDIDRCTRTWGVSPCTASLSAANQHKCFNSFQTCVVRSVFNKGVNTLRFVQKTFPLTDGNYFPALMSVSGWEQEVNIAGYAKEVKGIGQRASVDVVLEDFAYNDVLTDKYWDQRRTGEAQYDGVGYKPEDRGTFWGKFKSRNPNYAGRPLRVIQAHYDNGTVVYDKVRHYVMAEFKGPDSNGRVTIRAQDILSLASNTKAVAPATSEGRLAQDMDATTNMLFLSPAGIGSQYPTTGVVTVGSEVMRYTKSGDTLIVTRGSDGTLASSHSANDIAQLGYFAYMRRADVVIRDLLVNYARIPASFINTAEWTQEFDIWGAQFFLSTIITKPTGVTDLLAEIAQLGITIWWDEIAQKIRVKLNRPPDEEPVTLSDRDNIISITQIDNEKDRATRIVINYVQIDPTKELQDTNFARGFQHIYIDAEHPDFYGAESIKTINTRWLNHGDDGAIRIITGRLMSRYKEAPATYELIMDYKDDLDLTEVVKINSAFITDATGRSPEWLSQVYYRKEDFANGRIHAKMQKFYYAERYGRITENSRPDYNSSSAEQKKKGTYIVGPTLRFADGGHAYTMI